MDKLNHGIWAVSAPLFHLQGEVGEKMNLQSAMNQCSVSPKFLWMLIQSPLHKNKQHFLKNKCLDRVRGLCKMDLQSKPQKFFDQLQENHSEDQFRISFMSGTLFLHACMAFLDGRNGSHEKLGNISLCGGGVFDMRDRNVGWDVKHANGRTKDSETHGFIPNQLVSIWNR